MILVTGASGFIGSVLIEKIINKYGMENVLALTSNKNNNYNCILHNEYNFDEDIFHKSGYKDITTLIHAGAYTPKSSNLSNDSNKCTTNIVNTNKILKAELPNLKKIIFLSTLDVYAECDVINEDSPVMPTTLYGHSKLYCERLIEAYSKNNNISYQILRVGHTYGPGEESYQKVIPEMIRNILSNEAIQIFGTGKNLRSFIYIDDVVDAIISSIELKSFQGPINIVSNNKITINKLADTLIRLTNSKVKVEFNNSSENVPRDFIFDNSKMKKYLLTNEISLEKGLEMEFDYMRKLL